MSQSASPRGTFLKIADQVRAHVEDNPELTELPSAVELMREHGVSRGVALRVFRALREQGVAEPVPGRRWRVVRGGGGDRRPLVERIAGLIESERLAVGDAFPSASALAERFGVSRPTVSKVLDRLESAGWLSAGKQGKQRTVLAVPDREESSRP